jgi:hypothetical protein
MNARRWGVVAVLLAAACLLVVAVRWADGEFQPLDRPGQETHFVSRPDWIWAIHWPYRRVQNSWIWICSVATLAMGALVVLDGRWRRPYSSGTIVVMVALVVGGLTAIHFLLTDPASFNPSGIRYGLQNTLSSCVPGAILGALAATRARKMDWRGALVTGLWMTDVALLIAYGVLFG